MLPLYVRQIRLHLVCLSSATVAKVYEWDIRYTLPNWPFASQQAKSHPSHPNPFSLFGFFSLLFLPFIYFIFFSLLLFFSLMSSLGGLSIFLDPRITLPGLHYPKNGLVCSRTYQGQYTSLIYVPSPRESEITYSTHYPGQ